MLPAISSTLLVTARRLRGALLAGGVAGLLALAALPPAAAQAQLPTAQGIAAVVNSDPITTRDLEERIRMTLLFSNLPGDAATQARVAPQVLRRMIDERLQMQEAERLGAEVSQAEVDAAVERLAGANNMTSQQLVGYLEQRGVSAGALREQIRAELAWVDVVRQSLARRVVVTDEQVDLALGSGRAAQGTEQVLLSEILLPVYDSDREGEVLANARALVAELRAGADFEALARQFSVAATKEAGGDLGWVPSGALATALKPVVKEMSEGEVSDPVRTPNGVYIFKLRGRGAGETEKGEPNPAEREAKRRELEQEQIQRLANRYLRDLRTDAFVDIRLGG